MEKTSRISFLNNSVQYFESHDNFEFDDFANHACENENHYQAFKTYIQDNDLQSKWWEACKKVSDLYARGMTDRFIIDYLERECGLGIEYEEKVLHEKVN